MRFLPRRRPRRGPHRPDPRTIRVLLDFGASGARAVVARLLPDGVEVLGAAEVTGRSGMARPGQAMRRDQLATLAERALSAAEWATARDGELPTIADDALVGLTGPLLVAESQVAHLQRRDPVAPIFEEELLEALQAAQRRNLKLLGKQATASKIRRSLVASQLVGALSLREDTHQAQRLRDVSRGVPGLAGDVLAVAICNLTWPRKGLEVLGRVLDDLELTLVDALPIAQAVAAALPLPDAILLDIGHEHTEIALAEGGALSGLATVPMGGQFFTQRLMTELHLADKHAELLKVQHRTSGGRGGDRPVARVLAHAAETWHHAVEQALLRLAGAAPLPPRLYLFGGGAFLPEIGERLRAQPWTRRLPFEQHPTVERLVPHQLRGLHDPRGLLPGSAHVGIAALAAWVGQEPPPLQRHLETFSTRLAPTFNLA